MERINADREINRVATCLNTMSSFSSFPAQDHLERVVQAAGAGECIAYRMV